MEDNEKDINEDDIENLLDKSVRDGDVIEGNNNTDKERRFKLSEKGEAKAVDALGGQDIANVVAGFMNIIKKHGNFINNVGYEPTILNYLEFIKVAQIIKEAGTWEELVKTLEEHLEEESDWFKKNPHADIMGGE